MSQALAFLAQREYANAIRRRVRRLREPRYLLALGAAIAYLALLLPRQSDVTPPAMAALPIEPFVTLAAAAMLLWGWLFADRRTPLEFTAAELTWLFPAPIPRRTLILYKLARWQLPLLLNSLLLTLLFSADRSPDVAVRRVLALWILLATLRLHRLAASLVRSRWFEPDAAGRRRSPAIVPALLWLGVLAWAAIDAADTPGIGAAIRQFSAHPAARAALLPLRLVVQPIFAVGAVTDWLLAIVPAGVVLALHVRWVVQSDARYSRLAALAASVAAPGDIDLREPAYERAPVSRTSLTISPTGSIVSALVWKQLAPFTRRDRLLRTSLAAMVALVICLLLRTVHAGELAAIVAAMLTVMTGAVVIAGPQLIRVDLRRELARWDMLRALPISGAVLLRGLGTATVVAVGAVQLAGLLLLVMLDAGTAAGWPGGTSSLVLRALVLLPPLNVLGSLVALGGAVLFPAWSAPLVRRGGLDALGTNLLTLVGYLASLAMLMTLPLLSLFAVLGADLLLHPPPLAALLGLATYWGTAAAEAWLLLTWLGRRFERTDRAVAGLG